MSDGTHTTIQQSMYHMRQLRWDTSCGIKPNRNPPLFSISNRTNPHYLKIETKKKHKNSQGTIPGCSQEPLPRTVPPAHRDPRWRSRNRRSATSLPTARTYISGARPSRERTPLQETWKMSHLLEWVRRLWRRTAVTALGGGGERCSAVVALGGDSALRRAWRHAVHRCTG